MGLVNHHIASIDNILIPHRALCVTKGGYSEQDVAVETVGVHQVSLSESC
jgi:hypothetical protein